MNLLGIDVGATYIKYGIFTTELDTVASGSLPLAENLTDFISQVSQIVHRQVGEYPIKAAGIGIPGFLDKKDKTIALSPNVAFLKHVAIKSEIKKKVEIPIWIENDANSAAWGEFSLLPDPKPDSFVHLTLGSGIGSGIILNQRIWRGECGYGAELGHVVVEPEGRSCGCGASGCVETESSETGIVRSFTELTGRTDITSALEVFQLLQSGDPQAVKVFQRAGYYLGILFADIAHMLNPALISLGGGVAAAREALLQPAMAEFQRRIYPENFACSRIRFSELGNRGGMIGAAALASLLVS